MVEVLQGMCLRLTAVVELYGCGDGGMVEVLQGMCFRLTAVVEL